MNLKWPYQMLLLLFILISGAMIISPYIAVKTLAEATKQNNTEEWNQLVNTEYLEKYTRQLLDGLLRARMSLQIKNDQTKSLVAMQDYTFAKVAVNRQAGKIVQAKGFTHLLCGEIARFPERPQKDNEGCWLLQGELHWQSLTRVEVSYKNHQTGWLTYIYLERMGVLNWRVVDIALPIEKILKQLEQQMIIN